MKFLSLIRYSSPSLAEDGRLLGIGLSRSSAGATQLSLYAARKGFVGDLENLFPVDKTSVRGNSFFHE